MIETKAETDEEVGHPRSGIPEWKWMGAIAAFLLTSSISGLFSSRPSLLKDNTDLDRL